MQAYRSSTWRSVTLRDRIPLRPGVVSGPLMATRCVRMASRVASGSQFPTCLKPSPARTSSQSICRLPPDTFRTMASNTRRAARQMSGPVPSPSIKGMMGWFGTTNGRRGTRCARPWPGSLHGRRGCARRNVARTLRRCAAHHGSSCSRSRRLLARAGPGGATTRALLRAATMRHTTRRVGVGGTPHAPIRRACFCGEMTAARTSPCQWPLRRRCPRRPRSRYRSRSGVPVPLPASPFPVFRPTPPPPNSLG